MQDSIDHQCDEIAGRTALPVRTVDELHTEGFSVVPGPFAAEEMEQIACAYDEAVRTAVAPDIRIGSTTTRVHGLVHCSAFERLYTHRPILEACRHVIGEPFKLSSLMARTVHPRAAAQPLHMDVRPGEDGWPMLGFILMIDDFRSDNGSTRFVPGSHLRRTPDVLNEVLACGHAGSVILYNGSTWHGHSANRSSTPRRSVQGAYLLAI